MLLSRKAHERDIKLVDDCLQRVVGALKDAAMIVLSNKASTAAEEVTRCIRKYERSCGADSPWAKAWGDLDLNCKSA